MTLWPRKAFLAIGTFCLIVAAPQFIPQFYNWRVFEWSTVPTVLDFHPRASTATPLEEENDRLKPEAASAKLPSNRIQDPFHALDPFYKALLQTERKQAGAVTRILHYGDSPTTADMITADVRNFLQGRFGDAGHGMYLIAKPWAWYAHRNLENASNGWKISPATLKGEKDGRYGLAGVSFIGNAGAWSRITLKRPGENHITLEYLAQPGGGTLTATADGLDLGTIETNAPSPEPQRQLFNLPPDAHQIELRVTSGTVRLFSVYFTKDQPGVIYNSLGLNGMWTGVLAHYVNQDHWTQMLQEARPDLVIINYGTNESGFPQYVNGTYNADLKRVLERIHTALPGTAVLVMSPMDRGAREKGGSIGTIADLPRLVALQAKTAAEEHCAFFNTFEAMGGPGTMGKWYMAEPRLVSADFIHPLPTGGRIVATLLYDAILDGYNQYKLKVLRGNAAPAPQTPPAKPANQKPAPNHPRI